MRWVAALLFCTVCFGQSSMQRAVREGHELKPEQAAGLEQQLAATPFAVETRARLIGYYFARVQTLRQDTPDDVREARGRHVRWFIENDPSSEVLSTSEAFAMSGWLHDPNNYQSMRSLWLAEIERSPDKLPILLNAAYLLQQHDRPAALACMRKAYAITSGNDQRVADYYGVQLGLLWLGQGNDGSAGRNDVQAEIDARDDARVLGSAGHTIGQYSNPGGEEAEYARRLLHQAIALTRNDRIVFAWERDLRRIDSGIPVGFLVVSGRTQLQKRISGSDEEPGRGEGVVFVNAQIAADGTVAHTIAISGPKELQSDAAAAVKRWRFEPTNVNSKPVDVFTTFEVRLHSRAAE